METHSLLTSSTSNQLAYTAKRRVLVESIIVVNTTSAGVNYKVWFDPTGDGTSDVNLLQPQKSLGAYTKEELLPDSKIYLDASGTITFNDATGGAIAIHVSVKSV